MGFGAGYGDGLTIDRKDNDKGYSPENCQWVTLEQNSSEMCARHIKNKTGAFSPESFEKVKRTNREQQGRNVSIYKDSLLVCEAVSIGAAAEFIKENMELKTPLLSLKKNISACLHGKRKKCHGFTFA